MLLKGLKMLKISLIAGKLGCGKILLQAAGNGAG